MKSFRSVSIAIRSDTISLVFSQFFTRALYAADRRRRGVRSGTKCGKYFAAAIRLPALKVLLRNTIHSLYWALITPRVFPNVRSPSLINTLKVGKKLARHRSLTNYVKCYKFIPLNHIHWAFSCSDMHRFHQHIDVLLYQRLLFSHCLLRESGG